MGPAPVQNCVFGGPTGLCSGRVTALALDPAHAGVVYLGGDNGGIWKSTNGGTNWVPITDNEPSLAIGSIAVDTSGTVYAGTGVGNGIGSYGAGILKSADGGGTWTQLGSGVFGRAAFAKVAIDPSNTSVIIVATSTGSAISSTQTYAIAPGAPIGIFVSKDSGNTWTPTLTESCSCLTGASDVAFDPIVPSTVYAAFEGGIYKSTDTGSTWTLLPGVPNGGRQTFLGISASSHLNVFVTMKPSGPSVIFKSNNGGLSWSQLPTQLPFYCENNFGLAVDPTDNNTLYPLSAPDLCRTTDGGNTWSDLGGVTGFIHPDQHAFAFSPSSHSTVYVGNDGGVYYSTNADTCNPSLSCFTNLNSGLALTQFQSLATHPMNGSIYFGGTQDNGSPRHVGSSTIWNQLEGGDGGWTAYDRNNPSTMYVTVPSGGMFYSPYRSDDGGQTWTAKTSGLISGDFSEFYPPMAMDPTAPTTLYLGTSKLYKTTNRADNWFLPSPGLTSQGELTAIAVAPSNGQYVYVGDSLGAFYASTNGGIGFVEADTGLPVPHCPPSCFPYSAITKVVVDPLNPQRVIITYTGFNDGGKHVFLTSNSGSSWTDISSNLPNVPTNTVVMDTTGTIYVGTDNGVFISANSGSTWSVLGTGLPNSPVVEVVFTADGKLLAATRGRSVWALTFDFSISNSGGFTVVKGTSGSNTITVTLLGLRQLVSLACTNGLPARTSCSFNPASAYPTFSSTLTIQTMSSTPTGSYTITVTGTSGGGVSHTTQFVLTVVSH